MTSILNPQSSILNPQSSFSNLNPQSVFYIINFLTYHNFPPSIATVQPEFSLHFPAAPPPPPPPTCLYVPQLLQLLLAQSINLLVLIISPAGSAPEDGGQPPSFSTSHFTRSHSSSTRGGGGPRTFSMSSSSFLICTIVSLTLGCWTIYFSLSILTQISFTHWSSYDDKMMMSFLARITDEDMRIRR